MRRVSFGIFVQVLFEHLDGCPFQCIHRLLCRNSERIG